ncbi:MAG: four-carbon acid sugar kinase family protein [Burkholderiaceae bacterium]|nr:four-carbon acid sugar kinase family protein [Burkholderiales bacterium]MCZ8105255.1 four-carbon acid sugar kinase family protein [Burkholderiales bacterium]MCZ8337244.1 four-carbon acid sugar kinase family protein [Burkholderiaceae bacterium]
MSASLLGCIADDFTGATDLANNLVRAGMRTVQAIGVPAAGTAIDADAVVVALKSRTIPAADAVAQSLAALRWLRAAGCEQFYFKYCSTFDSTPAGNIGPVTDALLDALHGEGRGFTIVCPAFPENGRTIFRGHLFVGDVLLSDSGMRDHPLTPMTDANLVRVMQSQTRRRVGLVTYETVAAGPDAIRARFAALQGEGVGVAVVDAIGNADLMRLGEALAGLPLVTAGSGVAIGLPRNWIVRGRLAEGARADALPAAGGLAAVVSGSCSSATNAQVAHWREQGRPAFAVDPLTIASGTDVAAAALDWARARLADGPVLVYATAAPDAVRAVQSRLGAAHAGELVERTLAAVARGLVEAGVRRLVVAGGETSGAVVQALGVERMAIGPQIDPGVPWTAVEPAACPGETVHLALKSGNFGTTDFFPKAFEQLGRA